MELSYLFDGHRFDAEAATRFGFACTDGRYVYRQREDGGVVLCFCVHPAERAAFVTAVDEEFGEEFKPFESDCSGGYSAELRNHAQALMEKITAACFSDVSTREWVLQFAANKYGIVPDHPFGGDRVSAVLRTEKGKWYGLLMTIPRDRLFGADPLPIDVMNVKLPPDRVRALIDGVRYFRCYHMNKTHWITVALTGETDRNELAGLICESHDLVAGGK